MNRIALIVLCLLCCGAAAAQTAQEELKANRYLSGSNYLDYNRQLATEPLTPAPKGYEPFYMSHYGRHGSRWLIGEGDYTGPLNTLREARTAGKLTADKKRSIIDSLGYKVPEVVATQEMRQERFDNWELTDDHGMLIYGVAKDQAGKEYYMVKNSWGETGDYKGTWYMTKTFIAANTMDFLINKKAIPADIRKKLGL